MVTPLVEASMAEICHSVWRRHGHGVGDSARGRYGLSMPHVTLNVVWQANMTAAEITAIKKNTDKSLEHDKAIMAFVFFVFVLQFLILVSGSEHYSTSKSPKFSRPFTCPACQICIDGLCVENALQNVSCSG